jgi:peptidyl-prolyl cis-trans isomerase SurA
MKKKFKIILYVLIFSFLMNNSFALMENKIIVRVENKIITTYEVKNKVLSSLILTDQAINQDNINKLKKQSLESLIQLKLKRNELSKHNINYDAAQMNLYLNQISSNDIIGLKKKFMESNLDYELFYKEIETQLKWQRLIFKLYSNKIDINENDINSELQAILKEKENIYEFKISEIEILINNNIKDNKIIDNIKNEIKTQGFEDAAMKFSISTSSSNKGDIGWVNEKSLSKDIYDIISIMKIDTVSEPIKRLNSILFLKLVDKRQIKFNKIDITNLKKKLLDSKKNELFNLYSSSHLSKLKNSSFIDYK